MSYPKAIMVFGSQGQPLQNVIGILGGVVSPLTNIDGYALLPANFDSKLTTLIIVADGAKTYLKVITLSDFTQNIYIGKVSSNPNDISLPSLSFSKPFQVMNPIWKGNDCGIHLDYLPKIDGGSDDQTLFVAWLYHLYAPDIRARIRVDYAKEFTHIALSWIDAFDAGLSAEEFLSICQEWDGTGVSVTAFLCAKDSGMDHNVDLCESFSLQFLNVAVGIVPAFCLFWEGSLFLTTQEQWDLASRLAPVILKQVGTLVYIHEQEGYMAFPLPDHDQASFWWPLQGMVHGILLQRRLGTTDQDFVFWIQDCMARLLGGFNMPPNNGIDGRTLMGVAFELNYMNQFFDGATTESGNSLGRLAIANGTDGSCNGQ